MDKVIIAGTTDFSVMTYKILTIDQEAEVLGFTVNKEYLKDKKIEGLPVYPLEDLHDIFPDNDFSILLTIGYSKMNDNRKKMFDECKKLKLKIYTYISKRAVVYSDEISEGSMIFPGTFVGPSVKIGICNILHENVYVTHNNEIGEFCYFAGGTMIGGQAIIGNNCFTGMNSTIRNGIKLADRTFIAANSFISRNTKAGLGYIGAPAINNKGLKSDFLIKFV